MLITHSNVAGASASAHAAVVQDRSSAIQPAHPCPLLSPESLFLRLVAMFLGEAEVPRASRIDEGVASEARLELIVAANVARVRFWKAHEDEVTRAYAPLLIDKQECFA
mmetsp:Transcript_68699/g.206039  ORF Transcript_68699/g.206039 Transcript_68699/m.206039 type:complete len:109 (+) Transcript_68699:1224-1550(+)